MTYKKNSSFTGNVQFAWDNTSVDLWMTCPRKYYYTMIEGWEPLQSSVHLLFGKHYASALEQYHKLRASKIDHQEALKKVIHKTMVDTWVYDKDEEGKIIPGTGYPKDFVDNNKTRFTLLRSIVWYLEQYEDDTMKTYITKDGKAAVELSFKIPVDDGIILTGHLDRLVEYQSDLYVQDQKSTKTALTSLYFNQYRMSSQISQYSFAGSIILNAPVKGVVIDAAQILVGGTRFAREFIPRTDSQLEEWYENTIYTIKDAQKRMAEEEFPMNLSSCTKFLKCPFFDVCAAPAHVRKNVLAGDFSKTRVWDPLEDR